MAQVKLLKVGSTGIAQEFDTAADDITLNSFTVQGGGPVLGTTGLDMNNQDITDIKNIDFNDPTANTIEQTAGALIVDNIMAKERNNVMTTSGAVLFPAVADLAGEVDAFRLPTRAGTPTATPTFGGEGYLIWDSTNDKLFGWSGTSWVDIASSGTATDVQNTYTAAEIIAARDVVYISAADNASKAVATTDGATSRAIGIAPLGAAALAPVLVKTDGIVNGYTGLTATARYYLDATTAGAITATIPVGVGNVICQVGYAKSTTALQIQLLQLGRRA